jgi:chromosomal replication initiator protein
VTDSADVWTQVTLSLRSQLAESVWFSTFQDISPLPSDGDTLRLLAPSAYVRDRIMSRYLPLVTEALQDANEGHRSVEIDVDTAGDISAITDLDVPSDTMVSATAFDDAGRDTFGRRAATSGNDDRNGNTTRSLLLDEAGLNPRYTFETFVKGMPPTSSRSPPPFG